MIRDDQQTIQDKGIAHRHRGVALRKDVMSVQSLRVTTETRVETDHRHPKETDQSVEADETRHQSARIEVMNVKMTIEGATCLRVAVLPRDDVHHVIARMSVTESADASQLTEETRVCQEIGLEISKVIRVNGQQAGPDHQFKGKFHAMTENQ
jgi:hypothetical protein